MLSVLLTLMQFLVPSRIIVQSCVFPEILQKGTYSGMRGKIATAVPQAGLRDSQENTEEHAKTCAEPT